MSLSGPSDDGLVPPGFSALVMVTSWFSAVYSSISASWISCGDSATVPPLMPVKTIWYASQMGGGGGPPGGSGGSGGVLGGGGGGGSGGGACT